jgi:FlaA1/EpsC-like NDP-sugar epimerase
VVLALALTFSYWLAYWLRYDLTFPADAGERFHSTVACVLLVKLVAVYLLRGFHGWLRHVSFFTLVQLCRAAAVASVTLGLVNALFLQGIIPYSVLVLDFLGTVVVVGGLRCAVRLLREQLWPLIAARWLCRRGQRRVLLVGANRIGVVLANQINFDPALGYRVTGFLDEDVSTHGSSPGGIPIVGSPDRAVKLAHRSFAQEVLVLPGTLPGRRLRALMDRCQRHGLAVKIITHVGDLLNGTGDGRGRADRGLKPAMRLRVRDVDINDLLRREPIELDGAALRAHLKDRVVMVSGAGGSIGSEICRQVLRFAPRALVLVERTENCLFHIDRELRALPAGTALHACLADVTDARRMRQVFERHRPEVIFHAAAHKHVPLVEANPGEAIKNNVFGTRLVADMAEEFGARSFVLISTDKAVHPASVMGLTKQLGERYVQALAQTSRTRFVVVRFGNVLGSAGSVVPIFQEQIRKGGPLTITHPEMRRYFMTIPEASQLVLEAAARGKNGEIFVLEMGEPVKIVDLAHDLIRLSGLSPGDIDIVFTGPRPGEKLNEELYLDEEQTLPTPHPKLRVARPRYVDREEMSVLLAGLAALAQEPDPEVIRRRLREDFPDFGGTRPPAGPSPEPKDEPVLLRGPHSRLLAPQGSCPVRAGEALGAEKSLGESA